MARATATLRKGGAWHHRFVEASGRSQTFVFDAEKGQRRIDSVELIVLARALKIDAADLIRRVEEKLPQDLKLG